MHLYLKSDAESDWLIGSNTFKFPVFALIFFIMQNWLNIMERVQAMIHRWCENKPKFACVVKTDDVELNLPDDSTEACDRNKGNMSWGFRRVCR